MFRIPSHQIKAFDYHFFVDGKATKSQRSTSRPLLISEHSFNRTTKNNTHCQVCAQLCLSNDRPSCTARTEDDNHAEELEEEVHIDPQPHATTPSTSSSPSPPKGKQSKQPKQPKHQKSARGGKLTAAALRASSSSDSDGNHEIVKNSISTAKVGQARSESEATSSDDSDTDDLYALAPVLFTNSSSDKLFM